MDPALAAEVDAVVRDRSWLDNCVCSSYPLEAFFVQAGRTIPADALLASRLCLTRRQEVIWAYARDIRVGYFGGLSGGQRAAMTMEEALDYITADTIAARQNRPTSKRLARSR